MQMRNLISSVRNLDISIEAGGIVLEQTDPAGSDFKFERSRIIITALQVPQVATALRKAAAKFNANANAPEASRREIKKYKYTTLAQRAAERSESKKARAADGKESSEVGHDLK